MYVFAGDVLMEVVGRPDAEALERALGGEYRVTLWPQARLGDFTLQATPRAPSLGREAHTPEIAERLRAGGWQVLGNRSKTRGA